MQITAQSKSLNEIFVANHRFFVPPYQRPYSWEKEQREDFWDDVEAMLSGDVQKHFFGSILTVNKQKSNGLMERELVDGQQRITTIHILFCAMRDLLICFKVGNEISSYINSNILQIGFPPSQSSRLVLQEGDNNFYSEYILKMKTFSEIGQAAKNFPKSKLSQSQKKLRDTYLYFLEQIYEKCNRGDGNSLQELGMEFSNKMNGGVVIIDVVADALDSAYAIFESMNNRGLPLSAADLIKNTLLEKIAGNNIEEQKVFSDKWFDLMETIGEGPDLTTFMRHWWVTKTREKVTKDGLFRQIEANINDKTSAKKILEEVIQASSYYDQIANPIRENFKSFKAYVALLTVARLRATTSYPLLLQGKISLSQDQFEDMCIKIEALTVRYGTICKKASKFLDSLFQKAANDLRIEGNKSYSAVIAAINDMMPSDETVSIEFKKDTPTKNIDIILGRLAFDVDQPEVQVLNGKDVHVEHILPQTPSENWKKELPDHGMSFEDFCYKWGNLTLLNGKKNIKLQNSEFANKLKVYKESAIPLTRNIANNYSEWDYDSIENRTKELLNQVIKIWPAK